MKPLYPGQAAVAKFDGKPCVIICDWRENLPLEVTTSWQAWSAPHQVTFGSLTISLVEIIIRLEAYEITASIVAGSTSLMNTFWKT